MRNLIIFVISCILLAGCVPEDVSEKPISDNTTKTMPESLMQLQIQGYANGAQMPVRFATKAGGGQNISMGLKWVPLPAAQSYAVLFDDRHPVANGWVHWLMVDVPNTVSEISEGASRTDTMPAGSSELMTSWGRNGYDGPQPPVSSGNHEYVLTLYALDIPVLGLAENAGKPEFLSAIEGHVIAEESYSGYFER